MDADQIAKACAASMWAEDKATQGLGMEIVSVSAGKAVLTMTVRDDMVNGHAICHGGFMFLLADSAFAFSCNTYNQRTVAQSCQISFLKPVKLGDVLTATAEERWREGRSGIYDITVKDQAGTTVAEFRGQSRTIAGTLLGDDVGAAGQ